MNVTVRDRVRICLVSLLLVAVCVLGAPGARRADCRPNVLVIMMDDFGVGQFAPLAQRIKEEDYDPAFVEYVRGMKNGQYGNDTALEAARRAMPVMSGLASDGILFTRAFSSSALCAPSRCGFATGLHPNRFGVYSNGDVTREGALDPDRILAPRFREAGYLTGHIGKWHLGPLDDDLARPVYERHGLAPDTNPYGLDREGEAWRELEATGYFGSVPDKLHPLNNGFDVYYGYNYHQSRWYDEQNVWDGFEHAGVQRGYNTETFTDRAVAFIDRAQREDKPFLLNLHYHAVHGPLFPNPPDRYMEPFAEMPGLLRNFYGHVYAVDRGIRRVVDALRSREMLENTLLVFTSDNGGSVSRESTLPGNAPHRGHKGQYTLGGTRVPLVMHWPAATGAGRVTDAPVSLLDIMPTAMAAAGIEAPEDLDGRSLLPLIGGAEEGPHDHLVWFGLHSRSWGFLRETAVNFQTMRAHEPGSWTVVTDRWVLRFTGAVDPGLYTDLPEGRPARLALYRAEDDLERHNVADRYPETVQRLRAVAAQRAGELPPPAWWNQRKWRELIDSFPGEARGGKNGL
ncbi:sulfatase [Kiritimatiella glycovorans]|uniref:Arylsulfatase n=1 Tax=Kiritimatiella glycovorans TaxID=1307763 RepID=A0A0G3EII4_9BACT|nr:sulfatase-like hydrolase/transferase [Kiritimatiella glycovorans]AKJ64625.1 Arylsulfatase [Kiritimatiella glycovorans]